MVTANTTPVGSIALDDQRYQVIEALAGAGVGSLLRVHDRLRGRDVALRTIPGAGVGEEAKARFRKAFNHMRRLDHPHVARVHEMGESGETLFYTRELARGQSPAAALRAGDEHEFIQSLAGLADALGALHAAALVHGLAVPDHLRVPVVGERLGAALLTDAGLHHLLGERHLALWRNYLPPERRRGGDPSPASDMYSLGATLLEALGGEEALGRLARGERAPFRRFARRHGHGRAHDSDHSHDSDDSHDSHGSHGESLDRGLADLLDRLVDPDPQRRPQSGIEVLRWMRDPGWAVPERVPSAALLVSPLMVGRDEASAAVAELLRRSARGEAHAGEILGANGEGRSRLVAEAGHEAEAAGWVVVRFEAPAAGRDGDGLGELTGAVAEAVGLARGEGEAPLAGGESRSAPISFPESLDPSETAGHEAARYAPWAARLRSLVDATGTRLLILADDADRLPASSVAALRFLVTEIGIRPILVLVAGRERVNLPDAAVIKIGPLRERALRQLLSPLLTEALNPEPLFAALRSASGGNPLWVRLLLADWLAGGRLRFTQGRPFFDERSEARIPRSIVETVQWLVAGLKPSARDLAEAMAVWGGALPPALAARLVPGAVADRPGAEALLAGQETLVMTDSSGRFRFAADTFGPVVFDMLPAGRAQHWHAAILASLDSGHESVAPGRRAIHLLAVGRAAEAVRDFIAAAKMAESTCDYRTALEHYRQALANRHRLAPGEASHAELALAAARLANAVGDSREAEELLAGIESSRDRAEAPRALRLEILITRAQGLRGLRRVAEADAFLGEARALARKSDTLRLDLEQAAGDILAERFALGVGRLEPVIAQLTAKDPAHLLPLALFRLALLKRASSLSEAAVLALRSARLARRTGNHVLAAAGFIHVGDYYFRERKAARALQALDRARTENAASPHDGNLAAELNTRSLVMIEIGQAAEAERLALHARAVCLRSGNRARLGLALQQLGWTRRHLGRLEAARAAYREAEAIAIELERPDLHSVCSNLGEISLLHGEFGEAERLLRLALADPLPRNRGLAGVILGNLLLRRARFREALAVLADAESELSRYLPVQWPLAVVLEARVHLEAGDTETAMLRLARVSRAGESPDLEVRGEFHLTQGLLLARRQHSPYDAFERAITACRDYANPTRLAETLTAAMGAVLELPAPDLAWVAVRMEELEDAVSKTDARSVAVELRALRRDLTRHQTRSRAGMAASAPAGETTAEVAVENRLLRAALAARAQEVELAGRSPALQRVRARIASLAAGHAPVLITGERGTGKTALAVALHETSGRRGPLIVIDAAATPGRLARLAGIGRRPLDTEAMPVDATLLVEEVTALDPASQAELQGFLDRDEAASIIATSTIDLAAEGRAGRFHAELAERFAPQTVALPPLRERREDLELLVTGMAIEVARGSGSSMPEVPAEFVARCTAYPWPGNLAELRSCVATAFRLATGGKLSLVPIPKPSEPAAMATIVPYRAAVREFDRRVFSEALAATEGNVPRAARLLRLPESTFRYRAGKLELLGRTGTAEVSGAAPQAVSPPEGESRA